MEPPEVTAHAILVDETRKQILLIKCIHPTGRKVWGFPGGHIRVGEKVIEALVREVSEETGYEVEAGRLLGVYDNIVREGSSEEIIAHIVNIVYVAKIVSGSLDFSRDKEILDARWVSFAEAKRLPMSPNAGRILGDALAMLLGRM